MGEMKGLGWLPSAEMNMPYELYTKYYQIACFADMNNLYTVRRFRFKNPGTYSEIKTFKLTKLQFTRLLKLLPERFYKLFATYDLDNVLYPSNGECLMALVNYGDDTYKSKKQKEYIYKPNFLVYYQ